jgi:hypothetical protein
VKRSYAQVVLKLRRRLISLAVRLHKFTTMLLMMLAYHPFHLMLKHLNKSGSMGHSLEAIKERPCGV